MSHLSQEQRPFTGREGVGLMPNTAPIILLCLKAWDAEI